MVGKDKLEQDLHNGAGFSVTEALVIIVVLGILGFIGYAIYNAQKTSSRTTDSTTKTVTQSNTSADDNCTSKDGRWFMAAATGGQFSFTYPSGWKVHNCSDVESPDLALPPVTDENAASIESGEIIIIGVGHDKMISSLDENIPTEGGPATFDQVAKTAGIGLTRTTVAGLAAIKVSNAPHDGSLRGDTITFAKDGYQYTLDAEWNPNTNPSNPYPNVIDGIANSIKFSN